MLKPFQTTEGFKRIMLLRPQVLSKSYRDLGFKTALLPPLFHNHFRPGPSGSNTTSQAGSREQTFNTISMNQKPTMRQTSKSTVSGLADHRGKIPVNHDGQRVDQALPSPPQGTEASFHRRTRSQKVCRDFQLLDKCQEGPRCPYDHNKLKKDELLVLRQELRHLNCNRGPMCRSLGCYYGHNCLKENCLRGNGCRFGPMHKIDQRIAPWANGKE